jgi:hypothetical protein
VCCVDALRGGSGGAVGVSCVARLNVEIERLCMHQDDSREMTSRVVYTDMCLI